MNDSDDDGIKIMIAPEKVEAEARRFALRSGGVLLMALAEQGLTEKQLASMLEVDPQEIRTILMGETWRSYLPLAGLCLAVGIKMDLLTTSN